MSAADLARLAGVTKSELSLWESGNRSVPRTERVQKGLGKALGFEQGQLVAYLVGEASLQDLVPPAPSNLEQAIAMEKAGRWSNMTVEFARALEHKGVKLTVPGWVRQLDDIEGESRQRFKTRYELIRDGGILDDDTADS